MPFPIGNQYRKGKNPHNKGKVGLFHHSQKSKDKMSLSRNGEKHWNWGKHHSKMTINKMKKSLKGRSVWNKNKPWSEEVKIKMRKPHKDFSDPEKIRMIRSNAIKGNKHPNWKGGITPENMAIRQSIEFRLWREAVFARDNWTCQKTKIKGGKLHAHHIKPFSQFPELRFAVDNGITFSMESHKIFHKIYGRKNNTKEQILEFIKINNL